MSMTLWIFAGILPTIVLLYLSFYDKDITILHIIVIICALLVTGLLGVLAGVVSTVLLLGVIMDGDFDSSDIKESLLGKILIKRKE